MNYNIEHLNMNKKDIYQEYRNVEDVLEQYACRDLCYDTMDAKANAFLFKQACAFGIDLTLEEFKADIITYSIDFNRRMSKNYKGAIMNFNQKVGSSCYELNIRVSKIIHIEGAVSCQTVSEQMIDFIMSQSGDKLCEIFGFRPLLVERMEDDGIEYPCDMGDDDIIHGLFDEVSDRNTKLTGFLVEFETPMAKYGNSWSAYTSKWIYAGTFEEAFEKGKKWCEENRDDDPCSICDDDDCVSCELI